MSKPKVSVLMPIYNTNPDFLKESIDSILMQSFKDFEFLILNDSPDNLLLDDVVKSYDDKRIIYLKNKCNMGISQSRNKLLDLAKGEYIAIFDHDDISLPHRLEQEVAFLDAHPNVGCVSGWSQFFGHKNKLFCTPECDTDIRIMMTQDNYISHTACMIRKSVLEKYDIRYKEEYSPVEDYKLCVDLMDVTELYNIQDVFVKYRVHSNNTSKRLQILARNLSKKVRLETANKYLAYRLEYERRYKPYDFKLFGFVPFLRIRAKKNKKMVYLFAVLPILKF